MAHTGSARRGRQVSRGPAFSALAAEEEEVDFTDQWFDQGVTGHTATSREFPSSSRGWN